MPKRGKVQFRAHGPPGEVKSVLTSAGIISAPVVHSNTPFGTKLALCLPGCPSLIPLGKLVKEGWLFTWCPDSFGHPFLKRGNRQIVLVVKEDVPTLEWPVTAPNKLEGNDHEVECLVQTMQEGEAFNDVENPLIPTQTLNANAQIDDVEMPAQTSDTTSVQVDDAQRAAQTSDSTSVQTDDVENPQAPDEISRRDYKRSYGSTDKLYRNKHVPNASFAAHEANAHLPKSGECLTCRHADFTGTIRPQGHGGSNIVMRIALRRQPCRR
eukprot:GHVN01019222.1.p1 GENE.GHVN01019222.1~~GHVN01019222.1.p1  ORF type:complete len:268 (-),score=9.93 GHVN01019222.1:1311-2114(-)